ncbi:MAG TPA: RNA polymerase sigma-70 factor [Bacteroidales bacterium]
MADIINDELIRELKSGNQHAFDTIFKKYYTFLCIEARGYFKNHQLTEEIVCDVFTKLWQNREYLDIELSLREYLIKAVHNNCISYYRMQKVQEKLKHEVDENQKKAYSLMDISENPLEYTIMNEFEKHINEAIESLPTRYKQAFKLSRFDQMTYEEIAVEMGISINGVKMNMKKALEFLREKLSDYLISIAIIFISLYRTIFF